MKGYQRTKFGDEQQGFTFRSPSPNIRNVETAIVYPATVLLEATALSEGRGTDSPFMQFGAPFINSEALLAAVRKYKLPGITFEPALFTPRSSKFSEEICHGIKLVLTDRRAFMPFRTATVLLLELQRLYSFNIRLDKNGRLFDQLAGTPLLRKMIINQRPVEDIMEESLKQREAFSRLIPANHFLYN